MFILHRFYCILKVITYLTHFILNLHSNTPTKLSNAQHLVEKQLLYKENQNSGDVMQQPKDSYVCGINTSSESILNMSFYYLCDKHVPVEFWYTYFMRKVILTKRENFLTSNLYHKHRNA